MASHHFRSGDTQAHVVRVLAVSPMTCYAHSIMAHILMLLYRYSGERATAMISHPGRNTELVEEVIRMPNIDTVTVDGEELIEKACDPVYTLGDVVDSDW